MMISLSIFAFASTAVCTLMFGSFTTNRHVQAMAHSSGQAELPLRRIIELVRSAVKVELKLKADNTFDPEAGLYITAPPDAANDFYIFNYRVVNNQLHEIVYFNSLSTPAIQDEVMVDNVDYDKFYVGQVGTTYPLVYEIEVTLKATPVPIMRKVTITCRNLYSPPPPLPPPLILEEDAE